MSKSSKVVTTVSRVSTYAKSRTNFFERLVFGEDFDLKLGDTSLRKENIKNHRSVASIENKSRELLRDLIASKSMRVSLIRLEKLVAYLKKHRIARKGIEKDKAIYQILNLHHSCRDPNIHHQTRIALSLLGYVEPVNGRGIRILSLDGGGTRGVMTIEMLKEISERCERPIHDLFDIIVGTSTGAILAVMLGIQRQRLSKCESIYERMSREIFQAGTIKGTTQLLYNHAYYDTSRLEGILKEQLGDTEEMIDSAAFPGPKVAIVSTLVNHQVLKSFVFRNYFSPQPKDNKKFYAGTSKYKFWEAIRASTAAPGFFEEMKLDNDIHQDGGLLSNNPTAIAINEAKLLWPNTPIQAVVSLGTGTYHGRAGPKSPDFTTLRDKLKKLVYSATDVEATHEILKDLLPPDKYIRLNPNMSADVGIDVMDQDQLERLQTDTHNYIDKFSYKFDIASNALRQEKTMSKKVREYVLLQSQLKGFS